MGKTKKESLLSRVIRENMTDVSSGGIRYETVQAEKKKSFPVLMVAASLLITAMLMFLVFSFVSVLQLQNEVDTAKKELTQIEESIEQREKEIDEKYRDLLSRENGTENEKNIVYLPRNTVEAESEVVYVKTTIGSVLLSAAKNGLIGFINLMN